MTVTELIAKLKNIDGDKKVAVMDVEDLSNFTIVSTEVDVVESNQDVLSNSERTHSEDVVYIVSGLDA